MKYCLVGWLILTFSLSLGAMEKIVLQRADAVNLMDKLEENGDFFTQPAAVDEDDQHFLYFLSDKTKNIFKVDPVNAKIIKVISSAGQGPGELDAPTSMRIRDRVIYVADYSFGGIKTFDLDGKPLKQFKTSPTTRRMDVSPKKEIFAVDSDQNANPCVNVYNMEGKFLRQLVRFPLKDSSDKIERVKEREFFIKTDKNGNLLMLYWFRPVLRKYAPDGKLLWERAVENELTRSIKNGIFLKKAELGNIRGSSYIFPDFDVDGNGHVIVSHVYGGMIFDKNGSPVCCVKVAPKGSLGIPKVINNGKKLLFCLPGDAIHIIDYSKLLNR